VDQALLLLLLQHLDQLLQQEQAQARDARLRW
jgi:hypothetical protein